MFSIVIETKTKKKTNQNNGAVKSFLRDVVAIDVFVLTFREIYF